MTKASNNEFPSVLFDEQASTPTTPGTGLWRLYFKSDGLYAVDDAGTEVGPLGAGGGGGGSLVSVQTQRTAGNLTINSTASTGVNVDTSLDLTLSAAAGDVIHLGIVGRWSGPENVVGMLDLYTWDGSAVVNPVGAGLDTSTPLRGLPFARGEPNVLQPIGGSILYEVAAGDLVTGNVTFRLRAQTQTASDKTLNAIDSIPLTVWAIHLG